MRQFVKKKQKFLFQNNILRGIVLLMECFNLCAFESQAQVSDSNISSSSAKLKAATPVPGFEMQTAKTIIGNEIAKIVPWSGTLNDLEYIPIGLRFFFKCNSILFPVSKLNYYQLILLILNIFYFKTLR